MLYSAQPLIGLDHILQMLFIRCMTWISNHDKTFEGGTMRDNPLWDSADYEGGYSHDEGADNAPGTYKATKAVQKAVAGLHKRQPIITYESVVAVVEKSINGLK